MTKSNNTQKTFIKKTIQTGWTKCVNIYQKWYFYLENIYHFRVKSSSFAFRFLEISETRSRILMVWHWLTKYDILRVVWEIRTTDREKSVGNRKTRTKRWYGGWKQTTYWLGLKKSTILRENSTILRENPTILRENSTILVAVVKQGI